MPSPIWPILALSFTVCVPASYAAEFTINPLRVSLDRTAKATEINVRNDDKTPMRMQIEAMSWRQDAAGKDQYEATDSLLYFPRAMEIAPGESRIVRVGVKAAPVSQEEAYRLFIEELPPATPAPETQGTSVQIFLRVGVAVFVEPAQVKRQAEISRFDIRRATVEWSVANTGNVHFRTDRVALSGIGRDGKELFVQEFPERYFLAGTAKTLRFEISPEACARLASLEASVVGEKLDLKRKLDVDAGSCR